MPIPQPQPPSDTFNQVLLSHVSDKLRSWNVPGRVREHIIFEWGTVRHWMVGQSEDVLTVASMAPLLKKYVDTKLTEQERAEMVNARLSAERANALRAMSDRTLLEAIYKKLHE